MSVITLSIFRTKRFSMFPETQIEKAKKLLFTNATTNQIRDGMFFILTLKENREVRASIRNSDSTSIDRST